MQRVARDHLWMHFSRLGRYRGPRAADHHGAARAATCGTSTTASSSTRCRGSSRCRSGTAGATSRKPPREQAETLKYFPIWTYAHPPAIELAGELARARAGRPQPRVLHDRRLGSGRVGVEARAPVLPRHRAGPALQGDRAPHRVPRHDARRARDHRRARRCASPFEPLTPGGVARPQHQPLPRPARQGRDRVHRDACAERDRGRDPLRRPGDGRGGVPRAGAERGRVLHAARGLLPAGARDLRPLRRAARLRRGDLRVRPARRDVRRGALRLPPRHDHDAPRASRAGTRRSGRSSAATSSPSRSSAEPARRSRTASPSAATRSAARSRCANLRVFDDEQLSRERPRQRGRVSRSGSRRCTTSRSSATSAARATSGRSSW